MKNILKKISVKSLLWTGVTAVFLFYSPLHSGESTLHRLLNETLKEAADIDYHQRYAAEIKYAALPTGGKTNQVKITTEKGTEIIMLKDSIEKHIARQLGAQYALAQFHPLNPDTLNLLFNEILKEKGIHVPTGIVYRNKKQITYSENDSTTLQEAVRSSIQTLDAKNTIHIQAWAACDWKTLLRYTDGKAFLPVAIYCLFSLLVLWSMRSKKKEKASQVEETPVTGYCQPTEEISDQIPEEETDPIRQAIRLEATSQRMYINGQCVRLRKMSFQIMALLLATPAHRTTREEISHELWPKEYGRTSKEVLNNRMDGHINYLRDTLKAFPEVQLLRQGEFYRIEYTQAAFTCLSPSHF